jgi:hypothetical protein
LEGLFGELLRQVQVEPAMARLVEACLLDLWQDMRATATGEAVTIRRRLDKIELWKGRLVDAYVYQQALDRATYDRELQRLAEAATLAQLELRDLDIEDLDLEAALGFARHILTRTYKLWETADASQKRHLQSLVFPEGITTEGTAIGTPQIAILFKLLRTENHQEEEMVEQKGFEPSTPTLRTWCSPS